MTQLPPGGSSIERFGSGDLDTAMLLRQAYDRLEVRCKKLEAALLKLRDSAITPNQQGGQGMPWVQAVDIINEALSEP